LNRGEGYCGGATLDRCAAGQIDGQAIIDNAPYESFSHLLNTETPNVVFTQWPIDRHLDHRAVSALTVDAWLQSNKKFALYY